MIRSISALITIVLVTGLISACGTHRSGVIDTPETRGLKGWQKPYIINGKRYDPLLDHQGFVEEGMASWYGEEFHGGTTSNGEIYDMHAMTAAHKTLPLGIYVRVRNRSNDREIVVRINDRGPFVKERVIDLSMAAAKKLGIIDGGTAPVRIEALGYLTPEGRGAVAYRPPASYDAGDFTVQIAAFSEKDNAERLAVRMRKLYGSATIQDAMVKGDRFFRVRVGSFGSLANAEAARKDFAENGFPGSFIIALK
jgi:rare lipoprotein A